MKKLLIPCYLFACNTAVNAAGFGKAKSALTGFQSDLLMIIRILAVIALIIIGAMYMKGMSNGRTLLNWFVGVMIVGGANEIVGYFL
jgi:type IV secretory pathway VirB2 component (pilin)